MEIRQPPQDIAFNVGNIKKPILELKENGDILVKGKIIKNDVEVYDALCEFLSFHSPHFKNGTKN